MENPEDYLTPEEQKMLEEIEKAPLWIMNVSWKRQHTNRTITVYPLTREWEKWDTRHTRNTWWADVVQVSEAVIGILERNDESSEEQLEKIIRWSKGW